MRTFFFEHIELTHRPFLTTTPINMPRYYHARYIRHARATLMCALSALYVLYGARLYAGSSLLPLALNKLYFCSCFLRFSPSYLSIHNHLIHKKPSFLSFARMPGRKFQDRIGDQFQVSDCSRFKTQVIQFQISWLTFQRFPRL